MLTRRDVQNCLKSIALFKKLRATDFSAARVVEIVARRRRAHDMFEECLVHGPRLKIPLTKGIFIC